MVQTPAGCCGEDAAALRGSRQGFLGGFSTPLTFLSPGCERKTSHKDQHAWQNPYSPWHFLGGKKNQKKPSWACPFLQERFCFMDAVCEQLIYLCWRWLKLIEPIVPLTTNPLEHEDSQQFGPFFGAPDSPGWLTGGCGGRISAPHNANIVCLTYFSNRALRKRLATWNISARHWSKQPDMWVTLHSGLISAL